MPPLPSAMLAPRRRCCMLAALPLAASGGAMSGPGYLLAIDQGTTSTRAILFDAQGQERHHPRIDMRQIYPRPGWVEHDPEEIWQAVAMTCRAALAAAEDAPVAAIGITNQRE